MEKIKTTPIKNLSNDNYKKVISDILDNYKQNPEDLIELTKFSKNFTKYSINNDLLLYNQNAGATFVATYNQWNNLGYKVIEKGSGIKLLQPNTITFFYNENNELKPIKEATKIEQEKIKNKEYKTVRKIVSFSTFIVHDISATNCPASEYPNFYNMGYPSELHKNIADALIDFCSENKISVLEENLNSISIRGLAYNNENIIKLNSLMEDTQRLDTLVHEIGHIKLHRDNKETSKKSPALIEFEADLMSIMLSTDYNLEINDNRKEHLVSSFNAIDKENFDLTKTLNEVHKKYKTLSKDFDKYIEKQLTINNISLDNGLEQNRLSKIKEILDSGNYIQKSIIEAKEGEFCIGENKNPLQIIEKNEKEYKAIDLITKKEFSSSYENKTTNLYNDIKIPIFNKDKQNHLTENLVAVKVGYELTLIAESELQKLGIQTTKHNNKILIENQKYTLLTGIDFENSQKIYKILDSGDYPIYRFNEHLKVVEKKPIKPQGYKVYNLDAIKEIPITTVLEDLGYEKSRNGMYNIRGENTASMKVYENTNSYYDFGSATGGNIINLVKEIQNFDTKEAINYLGERYSIPYEQIGVDTQEKRLFISNKDWQNLGILYPEQASKNYQFNLDMPQEELKILSDKLIKTNMNDLSKKEPTIFKEIIQNNVIPYYLNEKNRYLHNLYIGAKAEQTSISKKSNDILFTRMFHNDLAKEDFLVLQKSYENLKKIKEFIPDLKIDKLAVDFQNDLKNIDKKNIEIGSFAHRDMKQLEGLKNYLTIPYSNFKTFEKEAQEFPYSAFLKGDKVTITVLNENKKEAEETIKQSKQIDYEKKKVKTQNLSLEK